MFTMEEGLTSRFRILRRSATWNYVILGIILLLNINIASGQPLEPADLNALNDIKNSIVPANVWDTSDPDPCNWPGITCSSPSINRAVDTINFLSFTSAYQIALPPSFSNFVAINTLYLSNAILTAPLPNLGRLQSLQFKNVSNIQWTAGTSLTSIYAQYCSMDILPPLEYHPNLLNYNFIAPVTNTSNTPAFFCNPGSGLYTVQIEDIPMTGFPDLSNCVSLQTVIFKNLGLTDPIPSPIGPSTLYQLTLSGNQFSGTIPSDIFAHNLIFLDLSFNQFSGTLDPAVFSMPLFNLILEGNRLEGTIPDNFQTSRLILLNLANNKLNGTIPPSLVTQTKLSTINLQKNRLTGSIPIFTSLSLTTLLLGNNQFTGKIPADTFYSNVTYTSIDLSNNQLIGSIPASLYNAKDVTDSLSLANNTLSGCVESGLYASPSKCDLSGNYFCCKSNTPLCPVQTNCRTCTTPKPTENATCIVDSDGNPVWLVTGDLIISSNNTNTTIQNGYIDGNLITVISITIDGVTVTGNLTVSGDLTVNTGIIKVQGCAFVNGSLTLNLTPEEIEQLTLNGTITRNLIQYDALCGDGSVNFNSIVVKGDVDCSELVGKQQTIPGLVSIVVTVTKIACSVATPSSDVTPGTVSSFQPNAPLPDWAIGVIVAGAVVIVGVIILAVLLGRKANIKKEEERITLRAASASVTNVPLRSNN